VVAVTGNLGEQFVLVEQGNHYQLAKQSAARGLQKIPRRSQPRRTPRPKFDAEHQRFAANRPDEFVAARAESRSQKPCNDGGAVAKPVASRDIPKSCSVVSSRPIKDTGLIFSKPMKMIGGRVRIVLEGVRGEDSIAELCCKEGINQNLYYRWSKEFWRPARNGWLATRRKWRPWTRSG
jgi:hypothetical protein